MEDQLLQLDSPFANFTRRTFLGVLLTAIVVGIITLVLTLAIDRVVLQPALCGADTSSCSQSSQIAFHVASVIATIVAVVMLVQASVYRPLLVAIAATISLWSVYGAYLDKAAWPIQLLALVVLNILAYFAFTWILRTYNFVIALVGTVLLILASLLITNL